LPSAGDGHIVRRDVFIDRAASSDESTIAHLNR
jgi:hypothetical protein